MEQAHRGELVLAGARLENDPVRNLLEPVFSRYSVVMLGLFSAAAARNPRRL